MSTEMQEWRSADQRIVQTLVTKSLHYMFNYTDPILSMSIYPRVSDRTSLLMRHQEHVSVNGATIWSAVSPYNVQWYNEQRFFLQSYKSEKADCTSTLQLIDIPEDKVAESVSVTFNNANSIPTELNNCPCALSSKEMQTFIVGGSSMQAIDIRSKKRLFIRHSAPVYALALYPSSPYSLFYLAGSQYLSLFTMDLRNQKEILLFPKAAQLSKELVLEVCPHSESKTMLYTIQSERLFTVVGHHNQERSGDSGLDVTFAASLLSRVAKHPCETFTWLHSILCYNGDFTSPYLVCSKTGSRLALLNATDIGSKCENPSLSMYKHAASRNKSLSLRSTISRACCASATQSTLAVAIDGSVYTTSIF